jgi:hypothetical protein
MSSFSIRLMGIVILAAGRTEGDAVKQIWFGIGLAVSIAATLFVTRLARQALRGAVSSTDSHCP